MDADQDQDQPEGAGAAGASGVPPSGTGSPDVDAGSDAVGGAEGSAAQAGEDEQPSPEAPQTPPHQNEIARRFLQRLGLTLPDVAQVRDALSFLQLLMRHPDPPPEHAPLRDALLSIADLDAHPRDKTASRLLGCAEKALVLTDHTCTGHVLELGLSALALEYDDSPTDRMACVELGLNFGGLEFILPDDMAPIWQLNRVRSSLDSASAGPMHSWVGGHVGVVCEMALKEFYKFDKLGRLEKPDKSEKPDKPFTDWSSIDLEGALLALRMNYAIFRVVLAPSEGGVLDLEQDFLKVGTPLWRCMQNLVVKRALPFDGLCDALRSSDWHMKAMRAVHQAVCAPPAGGARKGVSRHPAAEPLRVAGGTLIVCRSPIVEASDRCDKEEIARHRILEKPLPLAAMPETAEVLAMQARLLTEFPWAGSVLAAIFDELMGRAQLGVQVLGMPPTLLVGPAGSGKSRLVRRIADELGIPRLDLSLGGTSDTKVLGGTSRGWGSGKPSDLATLFAVRKSASAIVMLDELDKAIDYHREGGGIQAYLLGLLEPETARRHVDVYLKTECDYSGVLWIATANRLSSIQAPLITRLRVLMLGQPSAEHYPVIAENVLAEMANRWSLERGILPSVDELELPFDQLTSARQVRVATEAAVTNWAYHLRRH